MVLKTIQDLNCGFDNGFVFYRINLKSIYLKFPLVFLLHFSFLIPFEVFSVIQLSSRSFYYCTDSEKSIFTSYENQSLHVVLLPLYEIKNKISLILLVFKKKKFFFKVMIS
jgi:hypothetical protein